MAFIIISRQSGKVHQATCETADDALSQSEHLLRGGADALLLVTQGNIVATVFLAAIAQAAQLQTAGPLQANSPTDDEA